MVTYLGNSQPIINNSVNQINKELVKDAKERLSLKKSGNYVKRPIVTKTAEYYFDNSESIANVVEIKQEDLS